MLPPVGRRILLSCKLGMIARERGGKKLAIADRLRMAAEATTLDEYPLDAIAGEDTVRVVADRLATYGAAVREAIEVTDSELGDMDSADMFTEISRSIDKHLWFVEAHLQA